MIRNFIFPFILVSFHYLPLGCISVLISIYLLFTVYIFYFKPYERKILGYLTIFNDLLTTLILILIIVIHSLNNTETKFLSSEIIQKQLTLGWAIISILICLFVFNIVMPLALEWDSIRGLIETVKVKMSKKSEEKEEDSE